MILFLICLFGILIRLYQLDSLPSDMWGDVNEHYMLAERILNGQYFIHFDFGGDGPLMSYLIAGVAKIFGLSFYVIKFTSVLIDTFSIYIIYLLALELFKKKEIAYLSSFLLAVSFWNISFARQGKPYVLVPLIAMLVILLILKKRNYFAGLILGFGMYSQSSFWGLGLAILYSFQVLSGFITTAFYFITGIIFKADSFMPDFGYIKEKMGLDLSLQDKIYNVVNNIIKNLLAFNFKGDIVFRNNIPGNPHLDFITGIFFTAGFCLIVYRIYKRKDWNLLKYFIVPFILSQLASVLDVSNGFNVPNMGRMLGAAPFAYMAAGYGMYRLLLRRKNKAEKFNTGSVIFSILILSIFSLNYVNYFIRYPETLPNNNISFAKIIASKIDKYTGDKLVIGLIGCCWGDSGQPEPKSIENILLSDKILHYFSLDPIEPEINCQSFRKDFVKKKSILFSDPYNPVAKKIIHKCFEVLREEIIERGDWKVVRVSEGRLLSEDIK